MALAAVAALPQLLAWKLWWPRPVCCKCWRGGRGGRGCGAANAGVVAAVVVAAVLQMHIWYAHPLPYDGVAFVRLPKVHCVFVLARICLSTSSSPASIITTDARLQICLQYLAWDLACQAMGSETPNFSKWDRGVPELTIYY